MSGQKMYKLCHRCISKQIDDKVPSIDRQLLDAIDQRISANVKWANVLAVCGIVSVEKNQFCKDCPYVFAHIISACESIVEMEKDKKMTSDQERYKICLQCVEEGIPVMPNSSAYDILFGKIPESAIGGIRYCLVQNKPWMNYVLWGSRNLCRNCPYIVEHIALSSNGVKISSEP